MGLGTVWLAGTFNRKQFLSSMDIKDDELFPAISPVGYPLEKQRFIEAVMVGLKNDRNKKFKYPQIQSILFHGFVKKNNLDIEFIGLLFSY